MKTKIASLALVSTVLIFSCTKVQLENPEQQTENAAQPAPVQSSCKPLSFVASSLLDPDYTYSNFEKTTDPATGLVKTIKVGIYSGGGIGDYATFDVVYKNKTVSLLKSGSASDTALVIKLNNAGFADFASSGNSPDENFLPTRFKYRNGLVATRKIALGGIELTANFSYDANKNLVLIQEVSQNGEEPGRSEYTYDVSRKAGNQAYFDEPRGFSENTYMLLQYMGLLPLQPVNVRTSSKVYWDSNYLVYDATLRNHQVDAAGKLVSYESALSTDGETTSRYTVNWSCGVTAPAGDIE